MPVAVTPAAEFLSSGPKSGSAVLALNRTRRLGIVAAMPAGGGLEDKEPRASGNRQEARGAGKHKCVP